MQTIIKAIQRSGSDFRFLLKNEAALLSGILLGCEVLDQFYLWLEKNYVTPTDQNLTFTLLRITVGLLEGLLLSILIYKRLAEKDHGDQRQPFWNALKEYTVPLAAEGLRAFGVILLWTLALVLPGIYQYIRLGFVPVVVIADKEYAADRVDALEASRKASEGIWWALFLMSIFWALLIWGLEYQKEKFNIFESAPAWAVIFSTLSAVTIYLNVLLYGIYAVKKDR